MARITCPKCRHDNEAASSFCGGCAAPLGPAQMTVEPGTQKKKKAVRWGSALWGAAALLAFGIASLGGGDGCGAGTSEGAIVSTGAPFGDYTLEPTICFSGEHEDFFGVWIAAELSEDADGNVGSEGGLKLVKANTGAWEVYVESPIECEGFECVVRQLDRAQCDQFEVEVHNTNTTINDIREREGSVDFECETPDGGTLSAHVRFEGCA